jgi:PBP1b-binding outer membrane lipoprotein LpoB
VKKTIVAGALVLSLFVVGCNNDKATPAPTTEAQAVESMAAEAQDAVESLAAEVEGAAESTAAEVEGAAESMVAEAVESPAA